MLSTTGFSCSRTKPDRPDEAAFCPAAAFIDTKEYELQPLADKSDKTFHLWAADMAKKYPDLKNSYEQLRECWDHYHVPKQKNPGQK